MTYIDTLGAIAAILTTVSFLPQALRIHRSKDTSAISFWMYLIFSLGVLLWLIYGLLIQA
jgi:MtN3 and saliva related transmembrane protein